MNNYPDLEAPTRGNSGIVDQKCFDVHIQKVANGYVIKIGCATFVETSWDKVQKGIKEYFDDPEKAKKKYYKE